MQLSPEQFHTLFDRAAQPVLLVQDGVITQCSSRAEGLIAPGSPIRELLPPDAVLQELIAAAPTALPLRLRTGYVTAQVQPLEGALLLFLPVGDDDACTSALSRAAQAVSAPLTTLLSASGTIFPLLADVEDPVLQRNLAVLSRSCYQLLRASENLGDLSAALRGRLPLSMEKTDLTDFLDDFSQTAGDLCLQAGRELDVELPQAPIYLWADRRQLRRVLLALLSNAIKFTAPGTSSSPDAHPPRQAGLSPADGRRRGHDARGPDQRLFPLRAAAGAERSAHRRGLQPACCAGGDSGARRHDPAAVAEGPPARM